MSLHPSTMVPAEDSEVILKTKMNGVAYEIYKQASPETPIEADSITTFSIMAIQSVITHLKRDLEEEDPEKKMPLQFPLITHTLATSGKWQCVQTVDRLVDGKSDVLQGYRMFWATGKDYKASETAEIHTTAEQYITTTSIIPRDSRREYGGSFGGRSYGAFPQQMQGVFLPILPRIERCLT
jgi:hypothetical protein